MPIAPIDAIAVHTALDCLRQALPLPRQHPLSRCLSLQNPDETIFLSENPLAVELSIFDGLARLIRHQLKRHRRAVCFQDTPLSAIDALRQDFSVNNAELEAWSVLYYRFIRIDLCLSVDQIARYVCQTVRTLQRRTQLGTTRLAQTLIRREQAIQRTQHQFALRSRLPSAVPPYLCGRDTEKTCAVDYLLGSSGALHLLVSGKKSIGKSTFALAVAHRLITGTLISQVLWISDPPQSVEDLSAHIEAELLATMPAAPLSIYLQQHKTLIVIDNAEAWVGDAAHFAKLSALLAPARLILCSRIPPTQRPTTAFLELGSLGREQALSLLESQPTTTGSAQEAIYHAFDDIYRQTSGNPGQLLDALWQRKLQHGVPTPSPFRVAYAS